MKKAFTLIELMIVVVIVAIIAAAVILRLSSLLSRPQYIPLVLLVKKLGPDWYSFKWNEHLWLMKDGQMQRAD